MKFHIANMSCSGCVRTVTEAIKSLDAAAVVHADLESRMIEVHTSKPRAEIEAALTKARYPAHFVAEANVGD